MQNSTTIRELDFEQLEEVGGGGLGEWGISVGAATAFTVGAATVTSPIIAGSLAVGGLFLTAAAIYYAVSK